MFDHDPGAEITMAASDLAMLVAERDRYKEALINLVQADDLRAAVMREKQRRPWGITKKFPAELLDREAWYKRCLRSSWDAARTLVGGKTEEVTR